MLKVRCTATRKPKGYTTTGQSEVLGIEVSKGQDEAF